MPDPTDGADEVGEHGERADAESSQQSGGGDVPVEHVDERAVSVSLHGHALVAQLARHVARGGSGELDPEPGHGRAAAQHEREVAEQLERVGQRGGQRGGRHEVVDESADGAALLLVVGPAAQQGDQEAALPAAREHLGDDEEVGGERGDDDDGRVARVEEPDRVHALLSAVLGVLHRQLHAEALEVHHHQEHHHRRQQVEQVRQRRPVERVPQRAHLVLPRDQQVEQRDDRALELLPAARVHRHRRERAPHHRLADVRRDEQRDARPEAVALLQHLVQQKHDHARQRQLEDQKAARHPAKLARRTVHARHHVHERRDERQQEAEQLLHALEEVALLLHALIVHHQLQTRQQLHDHAGRHDGSDSKLHQSAATR